MPHPGFSPQDWVNCLGCFIAVSGCSEDPASNHGSPAQLVTDWGSQLSLSSIQWSSQIVPETRHSMKDSNTRTHRALAWPSSFPILPYLWQSLNMPNNSGPKSDNWNRNGNERGHHPGQKDLGMCHKNSQECEWKDVADTKRKSQNTQRTRFYS